MKAERLVIGADVGGSHITAGLVDLDTRQIIPGSLVRNMVDSHAVADQIIEAWCAALSEVRRGIPVEKLSVALPGPFDYDKGISLISNQDKYESLYGLNVKQLLAEGMSLPVSNIYFNNDAACFLQGEVFCGAAKGSRNALGITLGTGLGAARYNAREASDLSLWNLPFRDSIAEDYLSARWFKKRYFELCGLNINGVKELLALQGEEDTIAAIFNEFGSNLALFLEQVIRAEYTGAVVIGGNIANAFELFRHDFETGITEEFRGITIKPTLLGEEAALIGAASFWKKHA